MKVIVKYLCSICQKEIDSMKIDSGTHTIVLPYDDSKMFCELCKRDWEKGE